MLRALQKRAMFGIGTAVGDVTHRAFPPALDKILRLVLLPKSRPQFSGKETLLGRGGQYLAEKPCQDSELNHVDSNFLF